MCGDRKWEGGGPGGPWPILLPPPDRSFSLAYLWGAAPETEGECQYWGVKKKGGIMKEKIKGVIGKQK